MPESPGVRVRLFSHYLPSDERAGFAFDAGIGEPPTIVIRGDQVDEDEDGKFAPIHIYSCLGHEGDREASAGELADALEEIVEWLRQEPDTTEESEH